MRLVGLPSFGFPRFAHYSMRALIYAGKLNWTLLAGGGVLPCVTDMTTPNRSVKPTGGTSHRVTRGAFLTATGASI